MEVKFKNFCNRHIMLELPTIKTDFSWRTHRILIRLHMQDHNIPLFWLILSVYILTVLVLWNMFSKGHITVTSCLFPWYDPSGWWEKCLHAFWTADYFALFTFSRSKWQHMKVIRNAQMSKYFLCYIFGHFF